MNKFFKTFTKSASKKSKEFIKIIVFAAILLYYGFFIFSCIYWVREQRYISEILDYISNPFLIIVSSYLIGSAITNTKNIKRSYSKDKCKKYTFTFFLVLLIIVSFFASIIFFSICWVFLYQCPADLVDYIVRPFIIIFPTFVAKSLLEKRSMDNVSIEDVASTLTDIASTGINSSTAMSISAIVSSIARSINKNKQEANTNLIDNNDIDPDLEFNINILSDGELDKIFANYKIK